MKYYSGDNVVYIKRKKKKKKRREGENKTLCCAVNASFKQVNYTQNEKVDRISLV
jgi:hypothetical protein